jgi:hypothetical protein
MDPPLAYTIRDVARLLRCGPYAARKLVKRLGAFTIGTSKTASSKLYVRADVLRGWLEQQGMRDHGDDERRASQGDP